MKTRILKIDENDILLENIDYIAQVLQNGGTVVFPTETVYGLGANAMKEECVQKIFVAKGRPSDNPLIVHVSSIDEIGLLADEIPDNLYMLADKFWPGPLTVILKKKLSVPGVTTGGLNTVAVRIPSNSIAIEIIKKSGIPIAAPSANISGRPSSTCVQHVIEDLYGRVDVIVDGGNVKFGVESTVIDLTSDVPTILRPGIITYEDLKEVLGAVRIDKSLMSKDENIIPLSPGMKYRHYSPKAEVIIISGQDEKVIEKINVLAKNYEELGKKVGILALRTANQDYKMGYVINAGNGSAEEIAANLFTCLRQFDTIGVDVILSESIADIGVGLAIMNRLLKAAGYNILYV